MTTPTVPGNSFTLLSLLILLEELAVTDEAYMTMVTVPGSLIISASLEVIRDVYMAT